MDSLVTKLPASVADDSMLRLGEFSLHISIPNDSAMNTRIVGVFNTDTSSGLRIVGTGHFTDSTGASDLGKSVAYTGASQSTYLSPGEYDLFVGAKYTLRNFSVGGNNKKGTKLIAKGFGFLKNLVSLECTYLCHEDFSPLELSEVDSDLLRILTIYNDDNSKTLQFDLSDLKNIDNFERVQCPGQDASGDIALFSDNSSMQFFSASSCKLEGDIVSLGKMTSCTQIDLRNNAGIYGTVESLLSALSTNGKTSGTINIYLQGTQCTYNGAAINAAISVTFPY